MTLRSLDPGRALHGVRENLGLKIGLLAGSAILMVVLLLVGLFGSMKIPIISKLSFLQILLVMGILFAAFSMLVISIATTLMIQRPLGRLMKAIHRAESGDLQTRAKVESPDEIGQVASQFNEMLRKINGLEQNRIQAEHQLTAAQEELRYKALLEEKAAIIASTNRRLEESLKELSVLYNISQSLTSSIDPEELCNKLSQVITRNLEMDDFAILLVNEQDKILEVKAACGFRKNSKVRELDFKWGEGVTGQVARTGKPVYIPDTSHEEEYLHYKGMKPENGSFYSVPIMTKDHVLGVINFSRSDIDAFSAQEMRMLQVIAGQVSIALENARLYAKTKELSLIDELTQVFNRRHFHKILENEIKRAKRFRRPLSLLMLDVDHFKKFNDTFGHLEGDRLLVDLAGVLKENLREIDTVARYGGEEFAVILPNTELEDGEKVGVKINRLIREMSRGRHKTQKRQVTVSLGVSSFPSDAGNMDDLINHADIALYESKARGRDRVVVYLEEKGKPPLRVVE